MEERRISAAKVVEIHEGFSPGESYLETSGAKARQMCRVRGAKAPLFHVGVVTTASRALRKTKRY